MRAPPPPPVMLTAVSAFQRRASALLLPHRGAGTMSLANLSRIESMIGQRQDWPFGLSWAARLVRSAAAVLQCPKRFENTFQPNSFHAYLFLLYREFNGDARASLSSPKALPPFDLTDRALQLVDGHGNSLFTVAT